MPERTPLVAANWKMNKTVGEAESFVGDLARALGELADTDVVLCPPATALAATAQKAHGSGLRVAAQNMHQAAEGAFTGELSASMLRDAGVWGVVLGHSERRQLFGETDAALAEKVPAALAAGLVPILCVGETESERDEDETASVLRRQLEADLGAVDGDAIAALVVAYEPVWAIGTGRTATSAQAQEACAFIRALLRDRDREAGERTRILYGGSVKPENAAELFACPDVDGGLVGGASLDPRQFAAICAAAM